MESITSNSQQDDQFTTPNLNVLATLISQTQELEGYQLDISKDETVIGRSSLVDIQLCDPRISNQHCKIIRNSTTNEFIVMDCSTNGTYINKKRIGRSNSLLLSTGDELMVATSGKSNLGDIKFTFQNHCLNSSVPKTKVKKIEESEIGEIFEINGIIGKGSFGTVYSATHLQTNTVVALKVIEKNSKQLGGTNENQNLKQEILILTSLNHPNIIQVEEIFETEDYLIFCMELIEGGNLKEFLEKLEQIDEETVKSLFHQIIKAVNYLHQEGIVHRDLKLENVLVHKKHNFIQIKITDFGLSKMLHTHTILKTLCGTPLYIAPEVLSSGIFGYSQKVDIWSLGMILFQLLTGNLPIQINCDIESIFDQIKNFNYEFDNDWIDISENAKDLIINLLEKDPKKRFNSQQALNHPWFNSLSLKENIFK
ncbi:serine/threonine-protein kinase fhke-related [Anaeramoeba flamelloides]|uniref:Serine/threonine-protein kinase fhke-related n=1 Tax=Anaeramoeba flamelloides TaxID=1746091 RepID=A0ABQ8Z8G2_9EUKA|nr:serine/threonine-protein kinase fhke-related [Anaeramoeba flamelloides]